MAKKSTHTGKTQVSIPATTLPGKHTIFDISGIMAIAACMLLFVVHFIPDMDGYDNMGSQWLYLAGADFLVTLYILFRKDSYKEAATAIFSNIFSKLYLGFFVLAGLSLFWALNPTETWVCYARLIATVVAFFNTGILLYGRTDLFKILAQVLSMILLVESIQTISLFLKEVSEKDLTTVILDLKGYTGNKNIFAASTVVKIAMTLFCIHTSKIWLKLANTLILSLAALTLFLVNARASYLSLILIALLYIVYCLLVFLKDRKTEQAIYRAAYVLVPILLAVFVSQILITNVKQAQDQKGGYGTVAERLGSVATFNAEDNQVRINLWKHAIDYTKKHPLGGTGYGNWKIASIPYQRTITNDLIVPVHSHNDFLEAFAELGIIGGLLYFSLFICIIVFSYQTFFSKASEETKLASVFSLLGFVGYGIDAFFNFPMERPISQVFFVFFTAFIVVAYIKGRAESKEAENENSTVPVNNVCKPVFGLASLVLLIPALYVTYQTYQSLTLQRNVLQDLNNEPLKLNWKEVVPAFPAIPNLSATGQPIDAIKGRYLYEAQHYDEALTLLNKGREANPPVAYSEFLKAGLYFRIGKFDSAFTNGMYAFYTRPRAKTYYQTLIAILAQRKDTTNITKAFQETVQYRNESYVWNLYLQGMLNSLGKGTQKLLSVVDSSLRRFPGDSLLLTRKNEIMRFMEGQAPVVIAASKPADIAQGQKLYAEAVGVFGTGQAGKNDLTKAAALFLKAYSHNPADYSALENAAICYFNMQDWGKAVTTFNRELALNLSRTGKPEYFKGVAQINLGQKDAGCSTLQTALNKGWKEAEAILKNNCGK